MLDHVVIRASDRDASERFYRTVFAPLGIEQTASQAFAQWSDFSITAADGAGPTRNLHVGFVSPSRAHVDEFWRVGTGAGYRDGGAPGPRPQYTPDYYGAFLLDPDGNSIEAVHHGGLRRGGHVDHVWLRTPDLAAARRVHLLVAEHAGLRVNHDTEERVQLLAGDDSGGSYSVVVGEATVNAHLAAPATPEAIRAFHADALTAGYRDNGAPGPRPHFAPGYYAAFVLDADGNNLELVHRGG